MVKTGCLILEYNQELMLLIIQGIYLAELVINIVFNIVFEVIHGIFIDNNVVLYIVIDLTLNDLCMYYILSKSNAFGSAQAKLKPPDLYKAREPGTRFPGTDPKRASFRHIWTDISLAFWEMCLSLTLF